MKPSNAPAWRRTTRRATALCAALSLLAVVPGRSQDAPWSLRLQIELANGSEAERETAAALRRLVDEYDVGRWIFTERILIDEDQIPHSHPVLTIHTRHLGDDANLLSTFLHEQFHWLEDMVAEDFEGAMAAFEEIWPDPPVGSPEGARDRESDYRHLVVCDLEFQAMVELIGEPAARRLLAGITHYTWIYTRVLEDPRVREVTERFRMTVDRDFKGGG